MRAQYHLRSLRHSACREQGGLCYYCLRPMHSDVTAEHLQARRDGGKDTRKNIVAAHRLCNARRHQLFPIEAPEPTTYANLITLAEVAGLDLEDLAQPHEHRISTGPRLS